MTSDEQQQVLCFLDLVAQGICVVGYARRDCGPSESPQLDDFRFDVLCSDTFAWACADAEKLTLADAPEVHRLYREGGYKAVAEWVQTKRGGPAVAPFIAPL